MTIGHLVTSRTKKWAVLRLIVKVIKRWYEGPPAPSARRPTVTSSSDGNTPLAQLYLTTIDLQRDQIAAQLESASTNTLQSVAELAAILALLVAMLILRETNPGAIGWWWWLPLPFFIFPTYFAGAPIMRGKDRKFKDGPYVPRMMAAFSDKPETLENRLREMIQLLHRDWNNNDELLEEESRRIKWGLRLLFAVSVISVGLYAWGLN